MPYSNNIIFCTSNKVNNGNGKIILLLLGGQGCWRRSKSIKPKGFVKPPNTALSYHTADKLCVVFQIYQTQRIHLTSLCVNVFFCSPAATDMLHSLEMPLEKLCTEKMVMLEPSLCAICSNILERSNCMLI